MARPSEGLTELFVIRLEPETVAEIKRLAKGEQRSQQTVVRRAIKSFLAQTKSSAEVYQTGSAAFAVNN